MTAAWKRRCGSPASTGADLSGAGKILDEIDTAIRLRDKVLLILSDHSIKSDWVEDEVKTAYEEERKRGQTVLSPWRGRTWPGTPWRWRPGSILPSSMARLMPRGSPAAAAASWWCRSSRGARRAGCFRQAQFGVATFEANEAREQRVAFAEAR
jgi:hypothetical protein